jgi:hypothetical protein
VERLSTGRFGSLQYSTVKRGSYYELCATLELVGDLHGGWWILNYDMRKRSREKLHFVQL